MSGHTPGPWLYRGKSSSVHEASDTHPYGRQIFQFHEGFNDEDLPREADLSLILAAPQLLMALEDAITILQPLAEQLPSVKSRCDVYARVVRLAREG